MDRGLLIAVGILLVLIYIISLIFANLEKEAQRMEQLRKEDNQYTLELERAERDHYIKRSNPRFGFNNHFNFKTTNIQD